MGATIMGEGHHKLYSSEHDGLAIQFPKWQFPIVISNGGVVHYDNYGGAWGNPENLETLKDSYSMIAVQAECEKLGWYNEVNPATHELIIHHPSGGVITVQKGGSLDATGFSGVSCAEATLPLEQAMGARLGESVKPEMNDVQLQQHEIAD